MNYHDDFFRSTRPSVPARLGFALWFIFCAAISVAFLGVVVWAIITLVQWATTK